jgi:hypothetical protein
MKYGKYGIVRYYRTFIDAKQWLTSKVQSTVRLTFSNPCKFMKLKGKKYGMYGTPKGGTYFASLRPPTGANPPAQGCAEGGLS